MHSLSPARTRTRALILSSSPPPFQCPTYRAQGQLDLLKREDEKREAVSKWSGLRYSSQKQQLQDSLQALTLESKQMAHSLAQAKQDHDEACVSLSLSLFVPILMHAFWHHCI